jgi:translation initiation factor IF-3
VRLIDADGKQIGIVHIKDALKRADEVGLDLVEVAAEANPPVCRLMDYGKYRYEMTKREKDARKKQHRIEIKGIRLTPNTDDNDLNFKVEAARKFIESSFKVKVSVLFKGRLITHKELGEDIMQRFQDRLAECAKVENPPKMEGTRNLVMTLSKK